MAHKDVVRIVAEQLGVYYSDPVPYGGARLLLNDLGDKDYIVVPFEMLIGVMDALAAVANERGENHVALSALMEWLAINALSDRLLTAEPMP